MYTKSFHVTTPIGKTLSETRVNYAKALEELAKQANAYFDTPDVFIQSCQFYGELENHAVWVHVEYEPGGRQAPVFVVRDGKVALQNEGA